MEQAALRAYSLGIDPSAFNSVTWYQKSVQTDQEIRESGWDTGSAIYALWDIPRVLRIWGMNTNWGLYREPQYGPWCEHCASRLEWESSLVCWEPH